MCVTTVRGGETGGEFYFLLNYLIEDLSSMVVLARTLQRPPPRCLDGLRGGGAMSHIRLIVVHVLRARSTMERPYEFGFAIVLKHCPKVH